MTNRVGADKVICFACLGRHHFTHPACPVKPGTDRAWSWPVPSNLPNALQLKIFAWRQTPSNANLYRVRTNARDTGGPRAPRGG